VVLSTDELIVASGTNYTITLPVATGSGRLLWIKYSGSGTINVQGSGSDTIDGQNIQSLLNGDCLQIADSQTGMWVIL
jgi:hypothetical protein